MTTQIKIGEKIVPAPADLPDRSFRDAWASQGGAIVIDMGAAWEIARARIREARKPLLEKLDVMSIRSMEGSIQKAPSEIQDRKQLLRDAPNDTRLSDAETPEALKEAIAAVIADMEAAANA